MDITAYRITDELAVLEPEHSDTERIDDRFVVGCENHGRAFRVHLSQKVQDMDRLVGIDIARRLIGNEDAGLVHKRTSQRRARLLPTGELTWECISAI